SEPLPVAATFAFKDGEGASLSHVARLNTMVTVVDAANLLRDYASTHFLVDRGEALGDDDRRSLVGLLVEQIEFADVIVLNKADLVEDEQLATVRKLVASLNADARIIEARHGCVSLGAVLNTVLFDDEKAELHPLWAKELYGYADHRPESEEYGVESFVYRARAPFDPLKLHDFAPSGWPGAIRAEGRFWFATDLAEIEPVAVPDQHASFTLGRPSIRMTAHWSPIVRRDQRTTRADPERC
ncbi:MAG: GTP-binding protein, partial [Lysobacteraceae bacterium]